MVKFLVTPSQSQTPETLLPQTAVLEPDTLNTDNIVPTIPNENNNGFYMPNESDDGFCVKILDSGSNGGDADMISEDELTRFSKFLFEAQQKALTEEKARESKQRTYTGHSKTTAKR